MPLSCECEWLRIVLKGCHANPLNADQQVGIVALHILGQQLTLPAPAFALGGQLSSAKPSSLSSGLSLPLPSSASVASSELDVSTAQYLSHLHQLKAAAIDAEDFDAAKQMKARIDRLQSVVPDIVECERRKREAIAREDYDEAKQCKKEADTLREAALRDRGTAASEERKEDRSMPASQRGKRRESRHVVDMPEATDGGQQHQSQQPQQQQKPQQLSMAQSLLDDDRPIRPAKQSNAAAQNTTAAAEDRPLETRPARQKDNKRLAGSDEEKSEQCDLLQQQLSTKALSLCALYASRCHLTDSSRLFGCGLCARYASSSFPVSHASGEERPLRPTRAHTEATDQHPPTPRQQSSHCLLNPLSAHTSQTPAV